MEEASLRFPFMFTLLPSLVEYIKLKRRRRRAGNCCTLYQTKRQGGRRLLRKICSVKRQTPLAVYATTHDKRRDRETDGKSQKRARFSRFCASDANLLAIGGREHRSRPKSILIFKDRSDRAGRWPDENGLEGLESLGACEVSACQPEWRTETT